MMAWTAPFTAVANTAFTAAQFNQYVRDNLNETAPAKATTAGQYFVSTGANAIAARAPISGGILTSESTASLTYTDLTTVGPTVSIVTGTSALIIASCLMRNNTAGKASKMSYDVSGASTMSADDSIALLAISAAANAATEASIVIHQVGLTAGTNTFTAKYCVDGGTGNFLNRRLAVIPF